MNATRLALVATAAVDAPESARRPVATCLPGGETVGDPTFSKR